LLQSGTAVKIETVEIFYPEDLLSFFRRKGHCSTVRGTQIPQAQFGNRFWSSKVKTLETLFWLSNHKNWNHGLFGNQNGVSKTIVSKP